MDSKRREFLKKTAVGSAAGVVGLTTTALAAEPGRKIKSESKKRKEVLYTRSPEWELYYQNAK